MSADAGDEARAGDETHTDNEAHADDETHADDAPDALPSIDAPRPTDRDRRRLADVVPSLERDAVAIPGLAAAAIGLVLAGGVVGLLAVPVVVGLWALAGSIYAATGAALLLGAVVGGDPTAAGVAAPWSIGAPVSSVALVAIGVAWLVLAPAARDRRRWSVVGATLVAGVATTAVVAGVQRVGSSTATAAALVVAVALAIYGCHRYSLVRLAYRDPQ